MNHSAPILLVDDERVILKTLERQLELAGLPVVATASPQEALRELARRPFAVLLTDQRMPEISGTELCQRARTLQEDLTCIILTGLLDVDDILRRIEAGEVDYYVHKPWKPAALRSLLQQGLERYTLRNENKRLRAGVADVSSAEQEEKAVAALREQMSAQMRKLMHVNQRMGQQFQEVIATMAWLGNGHETIMGNHTRRVALLAREMGARQQISPEMLKQIEVAAWLHDVGKVQLHPDILKRPFEHLTPREQAARREHSLLGEALVARITGHEEAARFVRHHHEHYDGSGYPDGLRGEAIPIGSRIIAVANAFDHALNDRDSFQTVTPEQALVEVVRQAGKVLDPQQVAVLTDLSMEEAQVLQQIQEVEVRFEELRPGMELAQPFASEGWTLPAGHVLERDEVVRILRRHSDRAPLQRLFIRRPMVDEVPPL